MVFQSFNLYEHLTVVENCMLAQTALLKTPRQAAYEKAMSLLRSVGMEQQALKYPDQLSGGYTIGNIATSIVAFTIVFGCSFYEKIVSGVKAVGTGQVEAARAQGFTANQTFFRIVLPQAIDHLKKECVLKNIKLIDDDSHEAQE